MCLETWTHDDRRRHMNALSSPPMSEWNDLRNETRVAIVAAIEADQCWCCSVKAHWVYGEIRDLLLERERRIFRATMEFDPRNRAEGDA
jgi:hypothetical protein